MIYDFDILIGYILSSAAPTSVDLLQIYSLFSFSFKLHVFITSFATTMFRRLQLI